MHWQEPRQSPRLQRLAGRKPSMCILCGKSHHLSTSRRNFLKGTAATGLAAGTIGTASLFGPRAEASDDGPPRDTGRLGRRYVIRNGYVMSMDPAVGNFVSGDVLIEGKKILAIGPNLRVGDASEINARGRVVMPGF